MSLSLSVKALTWPVCAMQSSKNNKNDLAGLRLWKRPAVRLAAGARRLHDTGNASASRVVDARPCPRYTLVGQQRWDTCTLSWTPNCCGSACTESCESRCQWFQPEPGRRGFCRFC